MRLEGYVLPDDLKDIEAKLQKITEEKQEAINAQDYETAARLRDEEQNLKAQAEQRRKRWRAAIWRRCGDR